MTIELNTSGFASGSQSPVAEALATLSHAVDALAALVRLDAPQRLEGEESAAVVTETFALAGRLSAIAAHAVPVVEADGWWSLAGARSITSWVAAQGRVSHGQARRLVGLGRAFRDDLPITARDAVSGAVGLEAAHVLASVANTSARRETLALPADDCGEGFLVEQARVLSVGQLRVLARRWAAYADPERDDRGYREASEREFLNLADTTDGWHLTGFLTTEHGHALRAALDSMAGRSADQAGQPAGRRRAIALTALVRTALDRDLTGATGDHRPQITCVVDLATLSRALDHGRDWPGEMEWDLDRRDADRRGLDRTTRDRQRAARPSGAGHGAGRVHAGDGGHPPHSESNIQRLPESSTAHRPPEGEVRLEPAEEPGVEDRSRSTPVGDVERFAVAELMGTGPIPDAVLARLACDSQITRVVFGPQSVVLNAGRAERTYSGAKRRAIIARDLWCQFPGCDAPPAMSEVHHVDHWVRDRGETSVHTGVLVCWHHHEVLHSQGIEVLRAKDGRWRFVDRHGCDLVGPIG